MRRSLGKERRSTVTKSIMQRNADEEGLHLSKANPAPSFVIEECHECRDHFIGSFLHQICFTLNSGAGSTLLAVVRTTITAIETKTARPVNLRVEGKYAAGKPHAVAPLILKDANLKLLLLGSPFW